MTIKHINKMKSIHLLPIVAVMLCATACNKIDHTDPIDIEQTCMIVYTVDNHESRTMVKSKSDWETLLNQFCDYAQDGKSVTFYNLSSQPSDMHSGKSLMGSKEGTTPTTITTSNREEIKAWMRKMEQAGKTVNVTYDRNTGVWSGTAYANATVAPDSTACAIYHGVITAFSLTELGNPTLPNMTVMALRVNADSTLLISRNNYLVETESELDGYEIGDSATLSGRLMTIDDFGDSPLLILDITANDPATIVGTWQYTCLTEYALGDGLSYLNITTQYIPEENGSSIYYNFYSDGTATRTVGTSSTHTVNGSWNLSDGQLCCDLPDMSGDCWNIAWLTTTTMIISRTETNNENGTVIYQMLLERNYR